MLQLLEDLSIPMQPQVIYQSGAIAPPIPPKRDGSPQQKHVATRNFARGGLLQLELLVSLKEACIYRTTDPEMIDQFTQEIKQIKKQIKKIKGE